MARHDEKKFWTLFTGLAQLCNAQLNDIVIASYDMALAPYGYDAVAEAINEVIANRNGRDPFPSVKEIKRFLPNAEQDDEKKAIDVAARLISAVSKIGSIEGPPEGERWQKLKAYVGPIGWEIIKNQGGWNSLCEALTYKNMSTFQAQWRGYALALIDKARKGDLSLPPSFDTPVKNDILDQAILGASKGTVTIEAEKAPRDPRTGNSKSHPVLPKGGGLLRSKSAPRTGSAPHQRQTDLEQ